MKRGKRNSLEAHVTVAIVNVGGIYVATTKEGARGKSGVKKIKENF